MTDNIITTLAGLLISGRSLLELSLILDSSGLDAEAWANLKGALEHAEALSLAAQTGESWESLLDLCDAIKPHAEALAGRSWVFRESYTASRLVDDILTSAIELISA